MWIISVWVCGNSCTMCSVFLWIQTVLRQITKKKLILVLCTRSSIEKKKTGSKGAEVSLLHIIWSM